MNQRTEHSRIVVVSVKGELNRPATHRLVRDVSERVNESTEIIVLSFARTTSVRWNALCLLADAARVWRAAPYDVVVREARPSLRAMIEHLNAATAACALRL